MPHHLPTHSNKPSSSQASHNDAVDVLSRIKSVSWEMTEFVVAVATIPDSDYPHVVAFFDGCQGAVDLQSEDGENEKKGWICFQNLCLIFTCST